MPNRPVVLIPGLLCDEVVWADVIAALPFGTQTWVPDHGLHHSLPMMAQAVLQGSPAGPLWVVGHSMGGRVALEMYRQAPERIAGLALLDTGWLPLAGLMAVYAARIAERDNQPKHKNKFLGIEI